ncbi:MAG: hypothetical protein AAFY56_05145, partial [Pseudomonadota bacterium]
MTNHRDELLEIVCRDVACSGECSDTTTMSWVIDQCCDVNTAERSAIGRSPSRKEESMFIAMNRFRVKKGF